MINRSIIAAHGPIQFRASHTWILWAAAALCSFGTARPSQAAGCHTQDRPVIRETLSWEMDQRAEQAAASITRPPAVLTRPRCGYETPLTSSSSTLPAFPASLDASNFAAPQFCEALLAHPEPEHSPPAAIHLDRPPRLIPASFIAMLAASIRHKG
jgi:hypothetical protein